VRLVVGVDAWGQDAEALACDEGAGKGRACDVEGDVTDEAGGLAACGAALVAHHRACDGRGGHGDVHLGGREGGAGQRSGGH